MTRNTPRKRIEAREQAILGAAAKVFSEHGFDAARTAEIARVADVAEGTLYLYYRNKLELLEAVVGKFWADLTTGARSTVIAGDPPLVQLEALANYHLKALVENTRIVGFTYRALRSDPVNEEGLQPVRDYVRVFDDIITRADSLNQLSTSTPLWQLRDVFYGTLEFSARTLVLRGLEPDASVVNNLLMLFSNSYFRNDVSDDSAPRKPVENNTVLKALRRIERKLDRLESPRAPNLAPVPKQNYNP